MNDAAAPSGPSPSPTLGDAMRFAFGTLTVLPVRLRRWDRPAARGGMLCAPVAGLVIGLAAAALGTGLLLLDSGPLLAAVATAAVPAVLTRGLHLDGLADTADGLGSGKPAEDALRIMKQSDIGPFGVITLLFALLAQVAALAHLYEQGWAAGAAAALVSAVTARCALTLAPAPASPRPAPEDWAPPWPVRCRSPRRPSRPPSSSPSPRLSAAPAQAAGAPSTPPWPPFSPSPSEKRPCAAAATASAASPATSSAPSRRRRD